MISSGVKLSKINGGDLYSAEDSNVMSVLVFEAYIFSPALVKKGVEGKKGVDLYSNDLYSCDKVTISRNVSNFFLRQFMSKDSFTIFQVAFGF